MAEQIPYRVASSLINTLASLAFKETASIYGVKSEIDWLKKTVEAIKAVLADADKKQQTNQLIQIWIRDLKQVLYEADDLLDDLHSQHLLRNRDSKGKGKGKVREFFSSSNPIVSRHKIAREIRKIREKFDAVTETMSKLNLDGRVVVEMKHEKSNWRETSSKHGENIIGREESQKEIIDLLLKTNHNESVSSVAIVGIGGLGKTALAQLVYNNAQVTNFFNKKMWVCVSEEFDVKTLVKKILESSSGNDVNDQQLELLQHKLEENLNGQRYLLVLDDVWNEDREKWLHLKKYLMCGAHDSKVLLTTRSHTVANKMGVTTPYLLKGLTNDQSWTLLRSLAFDEDKIMTQNLDSIGQKIAEKCAGVPLAIRVMGSLLQSKSHVGEWEAILEGDFWKSCESNNSIMPILRLSYDSLTIELKQCFAYCSLYPKDWLYEKEELIDLWMANGFLENEDEKQCLEDIGEEYVRILLMKSFLQDVKTDALGEITLFKMHDLMHDLSQSIAGSDYCLYLEGRKNVMGYPLHASFKEYNSNSSLNKSNLCRLRTFVEIERKDGRNPADLFVFKCLRSLNFSFHNMRELPESIGKLRHLRYLNLQYCTELTCLPKSISDLVNLQTLILTGCRKLEYSEDIITKLINLHRLNIDGCKAFDNGMPIGMGRMTTLQHLSDFIVCDDKKEREKAKLNELKELNLRGRLVIQKLDLVRDVEEESKDVNLRAKKNLISLSLKWRLFSKMNANDAMQLLENLRPHENLEELSMDYYPGICLSDWLLSCRNLVKLNFFRMRNCQYLIALEGLVSLKTIDIRMMNELEYICYKGCSSSTNFFPSLEKLMIARCERLRGWVREENVQNARDNKWHHSLPSFPRLSSLRIQNCPELSCMPTFPNLVGYLELDDSSLKPLLDTLNVTTIGPSTSNHMPASLSMLKSLHIERIDLEALPEEWMQNLSSLKHLFIGSFSTLKEPFRHMRNLCAMLEDFTIARIDSCGANEDYKLQCQDLCCLHSLKSISICSCSHLVALPEWICDLHSLRFIEVTVCESLRSFPEGMCQLMNLQTLLVVGASSNLQERCQREIGAEWPKIAHIPNIIINHDRI